MAADVLEKHSRLNGSIFYGVFDQAAMLSTGLRL